MPLYDFECERCGARFTELVAAGATPRTCPSMRRSRFRSRSLSAEYPRVSFMEPIVAYLQGVLLHWRPCRQ